ncbi:MAG: 3'-5' exonuclease [Salinivirgaceae bacterium]|jgi:DNA polymerase-3 subunit epsilon|nr:3'-5' exonuclease [Salinivirgaceae bacterium]
MYLFFDTETTGLPRNYKAPASDTNNWPRLVQIAWRLHDADGNVLDAQEYIIKPEGFTIPKAASNIHRITTKLAIDEGVALQMVLDDFALLIEESTYIVAHNISFDEKIIGAEFIRKGVENNLDKRKKICTMHATTDFCKLPGNYGYKWPKLQELHLKLFGEEFEEAHDAAADIDATAKCFWRLKELGVV